MTLTPSQIQAIDYLLRSHLHETKWPYQGQFLDELTDHYTHSIQERMSQGETFDMALANTYDGFGQSKGIKSLEMNYWRLHARNYRWRLLRQMLSYYQFPRAFITLPLIGLLLAAKVYGASMAVLPQTAWFYHLSAFHFLLFGSNALNLIAWICRALSRRNGPLQPFFQHVERPLTSVAKWVFFVFLVEMCSNSLMVGRASPYIATFLYAACTTIHFSWSAIKPPQAISQ